MQGDRIITFPANKNPTKKCIKCGALITDEVRKRHEDIDEMLKGTGRVTLAKYCEKCARKICDVIDALEAEQWQYDWRDSQVKIHYKRLVKHLKSLNPDYVKFIQENKNKIFTLDIYLGEGDYELPLEKALLRALYTLREAPEINWVFNINDMVIYKDNRRTHKK